MLKFNAYLVIALITCLMQIQESKDEILESIDLRISNKDDKDSDAEIFHGINLEPAEKLKYQQLFDETFAKIPTDPQLNNFESIKQCIQLTGYNIQIRSQHLESILALAFQSQRGSDLYNLLIQFSARIVQTRPQKAIEIIDFELMPPLMQLLARPLLKYEKWFFKYFFFSNMEVILSAEERFHFLEIIIETLRNPSITEEQFLDLIEIVIHFLSIGDEQMGDIQFLFFENVIKPFILSPNDNIFGCMVDLLQSTIENTSRSAIFEFVCSPIIVEGAEPQLFLDYLLNRLVSEDQNHVGLRHIIKENILNIILNVTATSLNCAKVLTFEQGIIEKFHSLVPHLSEKLIVKIIQILKNLFDNELGIEPVIHIAQSGFVEIAFNLLNTGSFDAKKESVLFFAEFCKFSQNEQIQAFIIQHNIVSALIGFIDVKEKPKIWKEIIFALNYLRNTAYVMGASEENLFTHPLFQSIDTEEFYRLLGHMDGVVETLPYDEKESKYKELLSSIHEYCEILESADLV